MKLDNIIPFIKKKKKQCAIDAKTSEQSGDLKPDINAVINNIDEMQKRHEALCIKYDTLYNELAGFFGDWLYWAELLMFSDPDTYRRLLSNRKFFLLTKKAANIMIKKDEFEGSRINFDNLLRGKDE